MSLDNVANLYFQMVSRRDRRDYQDEQVRLADERLQLQKDQQTLNEKRFNEVKRRNQDAADYTRSLTLGQDLRNQKNIQAAEDAEADNLSEVVIGSLQGHAGYANKDGDLESLLVKTPSGMQLSEAFKTAIKEKDPVAMDLLAKGANFFAKKRAVKDGGYEYVGDATLLTPTGRADADGNPYYAMNGQYPDGEIGAFTEGATTAAADPISEFTIDDLFENANTYFNTVILNGSDAGRRFQNVIRSSSAAIDIQLNDISQALGGLEAKVFKRLNAEAEANDDPAKARALFAQYQAEPDENKPEILTKLAEQLGIEVPELLKEGGSVRIGPTDKIELPTDDFISDRAQSVGTVRTGLIGRDPAEETPLTPEFITELKEKYNIDVDDLSKPTQAFGNILTPRMKDQIQDRRGLGDIDRQIVKGRDAVTVFDRRIKAQETLYNNAKDEDRKSIVDKIENLYKQKAKKIEEVNQTIFDDQKEQLETAKRRYDLVSEEDKQAETTEAIRLKQELLIEQNAFDALQKRGIVTKTTQSDEFKSFESKIWGEDGVGLIRGRDLSVEDKNTIMRSLDDRLEAGIQFTPQEMNAVEKHLKENLIDSRERLSSTSFENQVVARAAMLMSAPESQRPALRAELDNLINTGDPTLSTAQSEQLEQNRLAREAELKRANAQELNAQASLESELRESIESGNELAQEAAQLQLDLFNQNYKEFIDAPIEAGPFEGNSIRNAIAAIPQKTYFAGSGSLDNDFSQLYGMLDDQINKVTDTDARGYPTVLSQNQKVFDLLMAQKDQLAMNYLQHKAKQGGIFLDNDFATEFNTTTARNLRANSSDPKKMTEFFFVSNTGQNRGKEVRIGGLARQENLRRYLIARVMANQSNTQQQQ